MKEKDVKTLILVGAVVVVALMAVGAWYLAENLTIKKGKRK